MEGTSQEKRCCDPGRSRPSKCSRQTRPDATAWIWSSRTRAASCVTESRRIKHRSFNKPCETRCTRRHACYHTVNDGSLPTNGCFASVPSLRRTCHIEAKRTFVGIEIYSISHKQTRCLHVKHHVLLLCHGAGYWSFSKFLKGRASTASFGLGLARLTAQPRRRM